MDNVVLVFKKNLKDEKGLNEIINKFDKKGYFVYILDDIQLWDFKFESLLEIYENIKNNHKFINHSIIISNMRDITLGWYRCFNSLVDDFIYFIDYEENNYFSNNDNLQSFFMNLSQFNGIQKETVQGKIFVNININNYSQMSDFLFRNNNFQYFNSIKNIKYEKMTDKHKLAKKYIYEDFKINFIRNNQLNGIEIVEIDNNYSDTIQINEVFSNLLSENLYFLPYVMLEFYKQRTYDLNAYLVKLYSQITSKNKKQYIFDEVFSYIQNETVSFQFKMYSLALLVRLAYRSDELCEFINNTLKNDDENLKYHYEILWNTIMWKSNFKLIFHDRFYKDVRSEIEKLARLVNNKDCLNCKDSYNDKKIAIVVDQLLLPEHSPTKLILDYAVSFKRFYPEYSIQIFVEDNMYCKDIGEILPFFNSSEKSEDCKEAHQRYIKNTDIDIYYSNVEDDLDKKVNKTIEKISDFNPSVIFTTSNMSITNKILYEFIPIVYMSLGGDYFWGQAHKYLCGNRAAVIKNNSKFRLLDDEDIVEFKYGLHLNDMLLREEYSRQEIGLTNDDFAMVTVGNRLNSEMDEEFIDNICSFLYENESCKWLIVGIDDHGYLKEKYKELINTKIIFIRFEEKLNLLYDICDVYLNPRRYGGGISIAMAMNRGLPVVITSDNSDGLLYIGYENSAGHTMKEYIAYLYKLYSDKEYREKISVLMRERIKLFDIRNSIDTVLSVMNEARNKKLYYNKSNVL